MFGIGDYSFAPYKVAISGLHKEPKFRAIGPVLGRPVMLDDTCYFVPAGSATEASLLSAFLNHEKTRCFIDAIAFWDAKRPITKRLLQRIDIASLLDVISADEIGPIADATLSGLQPAASVSDWTQVAREALAGPDPQLKLAL